MALPHIFCIVTGDKSMYTLWAGWKQVFDKTHLNAKLAVLSPNIKLIFHKGFTVIIIQPINAFSENIHGDSFFFVYDSPNKSVFRYFCSHNIIYYFAIQHDSHQSISTTQLALDSSSTCDMEYHLLSRHFQLISHRVLQGHNTHEKTMMGLSAYCSPCSILQVASMLFSVS